MSKGSTLKLAVVLAVVAPLAAVYIHYSSRTPQPLVTPGVMAPDFSFDLNGVGTRLADFRGRVVVLNFWATWCPPCVAEMPSLENLHRAIKDRGVTVLAVSVDEDADAYRQFVRENGLTLATFRDPRQKISELYGTYKFPETYIINPQGRVVKKIIGPLDWDRPDVINFLFALAKP